MLTSSPGARANVDVRYHWARNRGVCVDWLCLWVRRIIIGSLCVFVIVLGVSFLVLDLFFFRVVIYLFTGILAFIQEQVCPFAIVLGVFLVLIASGVYSILL